MIFINLLVQHLLGFYFFKFKLLPKDKYYFINYKNRQLINQKNPPPPRIDHVFVKFKEFCYLFGGSNSMKRLNDMYEVNLVNLEWKKI